MRHCQDSLPRSTSANEKSRTDFAIPQDGQVRRERSTTARRQETACDLRSGSPTMAIDTADIALFDLRCDHCGASMANELRHREKLRPGIAMVELKHHRVALRSEEHTSELQSR